MSLRTRVLAGMALIAIVLAAAAVVVTRTTERNLVAQVDAQVTAAAPRLPVARFRPIPEEFRPVPDESRPERISQMYLGLLAEDGTTQTIFTPNNVDDPALPILDAERVRDYADTGQTFTLASNDDDIDYRAVAVHDPTSGDVLVSAMSLADVDRSVNRLIAVELAATAAALALLAAVAWWVIRLGVAPIKRMTRTASAIAAGDLAHRVPETRSPRTEAGELGIALNDMLARIVDAFIERAASEERLRRFIADASHELRTPVATIRGYAELYRAGALEARDELREAMRRTEEEAVRMGSLIDDMLHLARLDQGRPLEQLPVDLARIAEDAARDARAVARTRQITSDIDDHPLVVVGDDHRLRQVVTNLVRNALVHTRDDAGVTIRAYTRDGKAIIEVADEGPGMPPHVATRAFERFYRTDASRSRARGGSGLGLAIVESTVTALGGQVRLSSSERSGTTVTVSLPLAGAVPANASAG